MPFREYRHRCVFILSVDGGVRLRLLKDSDASANRWPAVEKGRTRGKEKHLPREEIAGCSPREHGWGTPGVDTVQGGFEHGVGVIEVESLVMPGDDLQEQRAANHAAS